MNPTFELLVIFAAIVIAGFLVWWLIFESEGVYLGRKTVIWLYDLYASRYNAIKSNDEVEEHLYLAVPLMEAIASRNDPMVLDVAAGTGRIGKTLCQHPNFEGQIIALDLSLKMLLQGVNDFAQMHFEGYITWIHAADSPLPFEDSSFDVVTCMEALEFLPDAGTALAEMARVLRPGGLLLTTRRINTKWLPGKTWPEDQMSAALESCGFENIEFQIWQRDYDLVWARRVGQSSFLGPQMLEEVLRCPACFSTITVADARVRCTECAQVFRFSEERVLRLHR